MIEQNLLKVKKLIDAVAHKQQVTLIAVSKNKSIAQIKKAIEAGQHHFGENYLQEALVKIKALEKEKIIWHFIGPIQSNKTAKIAQNFSWVHSVDRLKIAKRLNIQRPLELAKLNILLQINMDNETTKSGVLIKDIAPMVKSIDSLKNIHLKGFMCIPKPTKSAESFAKIAQILAEYPQLNVLSAGMSQDLELAIKYGATFIRVGTAIFGKREKTITSYNSLI